MDEAAARRQRLAALRDRAAGAAATDQSGERGPAAHGNLRNPFDNEVRPQDPGPSFNYYSNPLAAFQPRLKPAMPRVARPQHELVAPMFGGGDGRGYRPVQQAPFHQPQMPYSQGFHGRPNPFPQAPFPPGMMYPGPGPNQQVDHRPFGYALRGVAARGGGSRGRGGHGQWDHGSAGQGPQKFPRVEGGLEFGRGRGSSHGVRGGHAGQAGGQGRGYYKPSMVEDPWARLLAAKGIHNVPPPLAAEVCFETSSLQDGTTASQGEPYGRATREPGTAAADVPAAAESVGRVGLQLPQPKSSGFPGVGLVEDGSGGSAVVTEASAAGVGATPSIAEAFEAAMAEVKGV
eukprot:jgi/Mesvir1/8363/Mv12617-RA.1